MYFSKIVTVVSRLVLVIWNRSNSASPGLIGVGALCVAHAQMLFFLSRSISWTFQTSLLIPGQSLQLFSEVGLMFPGWPLSMPALVYAMQAFFMAHLFSPAVSRGGVLKGRSSLSIFCYVQSSPLETCTPGWICVQMKLSHTSVSSLTTAVKSYSIQPLTLRFSRK